MEDKDLQGLQHGDRKVIKRIYEQGFGYCSSFVLNNQGTIDEARDLFQEALMVLLKNSRKPEFMLTCKVTTYLYSVMRFQWLKQINKRNKKGLQLIIDEEPDKEYIIIQEETHEEEEIKENQLNALEQALESIKEDCKELIMNFYYKKIDLSQIAEQMGYTYQFVKVKKNRCMNALKSKVKEIYPNE